MEVSLRKLVGKSREENASCYGNVWILKWAVSEPHSWNVESTQSLFNWTFRRHISWHSRRSRSVFRHLYQKWLSWTNKPAQITGADKQWLFSQGLMLFYWATAMGHMASSKICTLAHIRSRICQEVKLMSMLEWVLIHGRLTSQRKRLRRRNQPANTVILDFWNIVTFLL